MRVAICFVLELLKSEEPELVASIEELYELKKNDLGYSSEQT